MFKLKAVKCPPRKADVARACGILEDLELGGNEIVNLYRHPVLGTGSQSLSEGNDFVIAEQVSNDVNPPQPSLGKGGSNVLFPLPLGEGAVVRAKRATNAGEGSTSFAKQTETNLFSYSPIHLFTSKKIAFTLAEVLITLGIIGVVAALTMPNLIANYKNMVYENQQKAATSKIGQALTMLQAKGILGEVSDVDSVVDALAKELKVLKVCKKGNIEACFVDEITMSLTSEEIQQGGNLNLLGSILTPPAYAKLTPTNNLIKQSDKLSRDNLSLSLLVDNSGASNSELAGLVLVDGTNMLFMYNPNCDYSGVNKNKLPQANQNNQNVLSLLGSIFGISPAYALQPNENAGYRINRTDSSTVLPVFADQRACFGAIIDTNGNKSPNTVDKDVFLYQAGIGGNTADFVKNNGALLQ